MEKSVNVMILGGVGVGKSHLKEIIKVTRKNEYLLVIDSCDRITPRRVEILGD